MCLCHCRLVNQPDAQLHMLHVTIQAAATNHPALVVWSAPCPADQPNDHWKHLRSTHDEARIPRISALAAPGRTYQSINSALLSSCITSSSRAVLHEALLCVLHEALLRVLHQANALPVPKLLCNAPVLQVFLCRIMLHKCAWTVLHNSIHSCFMHNK